MCKMVPALVLGALLPLLGSCATGGSDRAQRQTEALTILFCNLDSGTFVDANQDTRLSVGDSVSYRIQVARLGADVQGCGQVNGSFYGLEQVVERRVVDGEALFLTHAQGTFQFTDGSLQTRSLGALHASSDAMAQMSASGPLTLSIADLFPEKKGATVLGQGGLFTGYVGTAEFINATPPRAEIRITNQIGAS